MSQPAQWRSTRELDRLRRAVEVRTLVNQGYGRLDIPTLKIRTLSSLTDGIEVERSARTA